VNAPRGVPTSFSAAAAARAGERWRLCLYVAGQSTKSLTAFSNLTRLCEEHLPGRHEIEVVDLVEQPARARTDDILAIPTLVRRSPAPPVKIIGDLSNIPRVLTHLQLGIAPSR
jgi:circadian clock protein KaiB